MKMEAVCPRHEYFAGYAAEWSDGLKRYIEAKKRPKSGAAYGARYVGSMVADVHRTIKYGGIFMYPATTSAPKGKVSFVFLSLVERF